MNEPLDYNAYEKARREEEENLPLGPGVEGDESDQPEAVEETTPPVTAPAAAWASFSSFRSGQDAHGHTNKSFFATIVVLVVIFSGLGAYYTYSTASGATFFGKTLTTNINLENGLVGHWTFDGPDMLTATTAEDVSVNNNHAGLSSGVKLGVGKIGQGVVSSVNQHLVAVTQNAALNNLNVASYSFWAKVTSGFMLSKSLWSYNPQLGLFIQSFSGGTEVWLADLSGLSSNGIVLDSGQWYHHVITYDKTNAANNPKIYINGTEVPLPRSGNVTGSALSDATSNLSLVNTNTIGSADDFRIYNRILSPAEVKALYNVGEGSKISVTPPSSSRLQNGLVGHWTFDGGDMTTATATDKSGNSNDGTLNGPIKVIGKMGQGLQFGNDTVSIVSTSTLNVTEQIALSTWIKRDNTGTRHFLISKGRATNAGNTQYWIEINSSNRVVIRISSASVTSSAAITDIKDWHHIVGTWDGSVIRLYIDGVADTNTASFASLINTTTDELALGNRSHFNDIPFSGKLDDVRIYNRALSADEVRELYGLGGGTTIKICRESSVLDADSNSYNTLAIGSQCWLDRNMNVGTRIAAATAQTNNSTIEKYCYSNSDANCTTNNPNKPDGGLYQWNEAMQYSTTEGARGICPTGFHVPTDSEWHTLEKFLINGGEACGAATTGFRCEPAGTRLMPGGTSLFEGNRAGYALSGTSNFRGTYGIWWSSSPSGGSAWYRNVLSGESRVDRNANTQPHGFSVRCLQDS